MFYLIGLVVVLGASALVAIVFRSVVPPNEVHIVQSRNKRIAYGNSDPNSEQSDSGVVSGRNVYYNWSEWIPLIGNVVIKLPTSIFDIRLNDYESYDKDKVPFSVDIFAQFVVTKPTTAAQKIADFEELKSQLQSVLQGVVRATLSTKGVEDIMIARKDLGEAFLKEANDQIQEYGVKAVYLEFMNIDDTEDSQVISNIQAKRKSAIDKESRVEVAENQKTAKIAEIEATKEAQLKNEMAQQAIGEQAAKRELSVGVANQKAQQEIQTATRSTEEKRMEVEKVKNVKQAEIDKEVKVVNADAERDRMSIVADGKLVEKEREAKGIEAVGKAEGERLKALELAPVNAKIELATAIAQLPEYMKYLLGLEGFKVSEAVGTAKAKALEHADIKVISTGGEGETESKINGVMDLLSPKGGAKLGAMIDAFQATAEGKKLMDLVKGSDEKEEPAKPANSKPNKK